MSIICRFLFVVSIVVVCLLLASVALADVGHVDTTVSNFSGGSGCSVGPSTSDGINGEITLTPTMASDFSSGSLPSGWSSSPWQTGGTATVGSGQLTVNNAIVSGPLSSAPASMEFEVLFANAVYEHAGFATSSFAAPWSYFSTADSTTNLYARTYNFPEPLTQTLLAGSYLGTWHRFRVDWTATDVIYFIDDSPVETQTTTLGNMQSIFSDDNSADVLTVDWVRMAPYSPTSCTFESRVFDSLSSSTQWVTMTTDTYLPTGTSRAFETRSGNLNPPTDGTWAAVTGDINTTGQYLQYRVTLTGTALATPRVNSVIIQTTPPTAVTLLDLTAAVNQTRGSALWLLLGGAAAVLGTMAVTRQVAKRHSRLD
jgi:hypothetical protein